MAKLSLGLGKNPPKAAKELPIETYETLYAKALVRMQAEPYILQSSFKRENYEQAAEMFKQLGSYQDAAELAEICRGKAEEAIEEEKAECYEKALHRRSEAESDSDWKSLADTFAKLGDYQDAPLYLQESRDNYAKKIKSLKHKRNVVLGCAAAVLIGIIGGTASGGFAYLYGRSFMQAGIYGKARTTFESMGDRFDAADLARKCEFLIMKHAEEGATINFAGYKWKALEKKDGTMLLMLSTLDEESPLRRLAFDENGAADWKNSSLRTYLNHDFLETFGQDQTASMLEQDEDLVTILNQEQAERYQEIITTRTDSWLRTPAQQDGMEMIRLANGQVLQEGITADSTQIVTWPVVLVDYAHAIEEG